MCRRISLFRRDTVTGQCFFFISLNAESFLITVSQTCNGMDAAPSDSFPDPLQRFLVILCHRAPENAPPLKGRLYSSLDNPEENIWQIF